MSKLFFAFPSLVLVVILVLGMAQKHEIPPALIGEVPVGTILVWWGKAVDLPPGYEVCDGTTISTKDAVLRGRKPDLRNKFVRGTEDFRSFVPLAFAGGGIEQVNNETATVELTINSTPITLAANQLPPHNHSIEASEHRIVTSTTPGAPPVNSGKPSSIAHQHTVDLANTSNTTAGGGDTHVTVSAGSNFTTTQWPASTDAVIESHPRSATVAPLLGATNQPALGPQQPITHTHTANLAQVTLNQRENRPPFLDMILILRVK